MRLWFGLLLWGMFSLAACEVKVVDMPNPQPPTPLFIKGADLSFLPRIEATGHSFYNAYGVAEDVLLTLKNAGLNTVRLRLWHSPSDAHSGLAEVKALTNRARDLGLKTWLTVHYSDTWADPAQQELPQVWANLSFKSLKDSAYRYTQMVMQELEPDYIQVGNEINSGMLHPHGNIQTQQPQFLALLAEGCRAVRETSSSCKIILHFAGLDASDWFFQQVAAVDYDIIGISYYPIWHGRDLEFLKQTLTNLSIAHDKPIVLAEFAYPFTLGWNDWTNNIVGLDEHLILPAYPANEAGQQAFVLRLRRMMEEEVEKGIGFCYWGGEWVAYNGNQSPNGSAWENQALYDFNSRLLPAAALFTD